MPNAHIQPARRLGWWHGWDGGTAAPCQQRRRRRLAATGQGPATQGPATGRVYRATCPLEGWEALAESLGPLYPPQLQLHHYVVLEAAQQAAGTMPDAPLIAAYDFLPADPTSPITAALLLSGGSVPGIARSRQLRGVPRQRCQLVGCTTLSDPHAAAAAFQRRYARGLQLLRDDCTHHADRLIDHLLRSSQ
ncbi:hypothetical protein CHLNCDRAFT_137563 [Chlorella variabilis]|uniref:Uncharacterized protein n=1 Tax=Chlorella variabilis TaxID=554065 RepID=E1Z3Z3_CHLVA|nr:hypothetical protein CHLNCDRAFT_137563 [Chlorella variabilis]EFN58965.1 hypothetical protein CHLNCDRAFT_137563 [Chlorella variabilis]|eukprot:XP_005851067.1 hypothetical protein CHLNCDRAFT_137563 [Chlorella variabilis]